MSFRETTGYTRSAVNAGDFFKNHGRQEMRDDTTGELRPERTWMVERLLDYEDVGRTVEFGEKTAVQIASLLGYVSKHFHEMNKEKLADTRAANAVMTEKIDELETANRILIKELNNCYAESE